jgi:hypothetical protein
MRRRDHDVCAMERRAACAGAQKGRRGASHDERSQLGAKPSRLCLARPFFCPASQIPPHHRLFHPPPIALPLHPNTTDSFKPPPMRPATFSPLLHLDYAPASPSPMPKSPPSPPRADARVTSPSAGMPADSDSDGASTRARRRRNAKPAANGDANGHLDVPKASRPSGGRLADRSPSPLGLIPIHTRFRSFVRSSSLRRALEANIRDRSTATKSPAKPSTSRSASSRSPSTPRAAHPRRSTPSCSPRSCPSPPSTCCATACPRSTGCT